MIYIFYILLFANFLCVIGKVDYKIKRIVFALSVILLTILMCGHHYIGNGDSRDFYGYWNDYQNLQRGISRDFGFYYLFYFTQLVAIKMGLSFYAWWAIMTVLSWGIIIKTCKLFQVVPHFFLVFFMLYYVFIFYTGLKFWYGFCMLLVAVGYYCSSSSRRIFLFVLFTLLAGGFHVMYYIFLLLLLGEIKIITPKRLFSITVVLFIGVFLFGRNRFLSAFEPILNSMFSSLDSENLNSYFTSRTNLGFVFPVAAQLLSLTISKINKEYLCNKENIDEEEILFSDRLYQLNLICVLFYPLFLFALTFMRLITAFSLVTIILVSRSIDEHSLREKNVVLGISLLLIGIFAYVNFGMSDYYHYAYIPFFDNYYINFFLQ